MSNYMYKTDAPTVVAAVNAWEAKRKEWDAQRDKLPPAVRAEAARGITANEASKALKMHIKRVTLIVQENGFRFAESP